MVEFEVEQKPWGLQAQNVNLVRGMIETEKSTVSSVTNHSVKEMSQAVEHLKRQIEGMKVKEQEFKRFKSRYQDMLRQNQLLNDTTHHMQREVYKFLRAVVEIANASRDFRRRDMIDYARKVLAGLGYDIKGISYDDGE
jgi:leucyl aminopeptidase